jgi:D-alanyl-lipoteichoic acid acyltransferase DltB (MBOAT superfamily)
LAIGLSIFALGLFKKTVLADRRRQQSPTRLRRRSRGRHAQLFQAWLGALAYTLQLYFDFSAYSDMAIGLGAMFGMRLPLNFDRPTGHEHHRVLAALAHDAVALPARLSLHPARRQPSRGGGASGNLMLTMLLGGLWHGAGWTFIAWGALHGLVHQSFLASQNKNFRTRVHQPPLGLFVALGMPNVYQWLKGEWRLKKLPLVGRLQFSALQGLALGSLFWLCLLAVQFVQAEFLYFNF